MILLSVVYVHMGGVKGEPGSNSFVFDAPVNQSFLLGLVDTTPTYNSLLVPSFCTECYRSTCTETDNSSGIQQYNK